MVVVTWVRWCLCGVLMWKGGYMCVGCDVGGRVSVWGLGCGWEGVCVGF